MACLTYQLDKVPDLALVKYQAMGDNDVDGLVERHNEFLRQWNRITILSKTRITLFIVYSSNNPINNKMQFYISLYTERDDMLASLERLISASPLNDYYSVECLGLDFSPSVLKRNYANEAILKKIERKRITDSNIDPNAPPLYTVSGWTSSESARLRDMMRIMNTLNEDSMYAVSFEGVDGFSKAFCAMERPVAYLRQKTSTRSSQAVTLTSTVKTSARDIVAEETLACYEKFLTTAMESPCFQANIRAFSDSESGAEFLLAAAAGESISDGNAEIMSLKTPEQTVSILDHHIFFHKILPDSLAFWPTMFTLEELSPFFRMPILLESENLDIPKETLAEYSSSGIQIGKDTQDISVSLPMKLLKKHAFVCGVPGAGKTNTMLGLCYELWNKFKIPFLVLEPAKKEYRALAQTDMDDLILFSPSSGSRFPLAINPFEFPKNMSLAEHIQNLMEVFEGAFPLVPPLPALLDRAIESVYLDHGWDVEDINTGELEYPTMSELYAKLEDELEKTDYDGEVRGNMKSALEMRIGSLLRRDLGNVFDVPSSTLCPEDWICHPIIIEMESLGSGPSNFLTLMLCTLIRELLRTNPKDNPEAEIRHVIFIEEAHNLIAPECSDVTGEDANPKAAATSYIVKMLAEVRALREGIIIADQLPTAMAPEILKNTTLKIAHRMTAQDDRGLIGSTMNASPVQLEEMATYIPGETLIYYEGLLKPFKLRVNLFPLKDPPDNDVLYTLMKRRTNHCKVNNYTIQIRAIKLLSMWSVEWKETVKIYRKLLADCDRLSGEEADKDIKAVLNQIMRDQLGLNASNDQLKKILMRYHRWTRDVELPNVLTDAFSSCEKDMNKLIQSARKKIDSTKF